MLETNCPCGKKIKYQACCYPFHINKKYPLTAELLMRSRYSAYVLKNEAYILKTWDTDSSPKNMGFSEDYTQWIKLEIVRIKKGREKDIKGSVEFKAFYIQNGETYVMNEISQFRKAAGNWLYTVGNVRSIIKLDHFL